MTKDESDFWKDVLVTMLRSGHSPDAAVAGANDCLKAFRKILPEPEVKPDSQGALVRVAGVDDVLAAYPWAQLDGEGCIIDRRDGSYPVTMEDTDDGISWLAWVTPDLDGTACVHVHSIDKACIHVDWPAWDKKGTPAGKGLPVVPIKITCAAEPDGDGELLCEVIGLDHYTQSFGFSRLAAVAGALRQFADILDDERDSEAGEPE